MAKRCLVRFLYHNNLWHECNRTLKQTTYDPIIFFSSSFLPRLSSEFVHLASHPRFSSSFLGEVVCSPLSLWYSRKTNLQVTWITNHHLFASNYFFYFFISKILNSNFWPKIKIKILGQLKLNLGQKFR